MIQPITLTFYPANFVITDPPVTYFPYTVNITEASVTEGSSAGLNFTYWKDPAATVPLSRPGEINLSGTYYIKASNPGCSEVKAVNVIIKNEIVNTFTPNDDGMNDLFSVFRFSGVRTNRFRIYNRWGRLVFDNIKHGEAWDGTFNGRKQPVGTYFWIWDAFDLNAQKPLHQSGSISLIR